MSRTKLITLLATFMLVLIGLAAYILTLDKTQKSVTTSALIGGDFTMVDHHGATVTQDSYKAFKTLIFFGFTNCPAVCPTELANFATAIDELGEEKTKNLKLLFVTIDPEYDTPERMKEYVEYFSDDFIGLTGSIDQVSKIAKAFRVYYAKVSDEDSALKYTMDHSAYTYLMDENNQYLTHISPNSEVEDMVNKLKEHL
ncbi:MAG: SCO family protein [Rhizobiales bacterium]|nr:SCO family protein [Hyphomicrobiales bacterium]